MHSQQMFNECIAEAGDLPAVSSQDDVDDGGNCLPPTVYRVVLSYLPATDTEKEEHNIALLLLLKFLDVLEGTHFGCRGIETLARLKQKRKRQKGEGIRQWTGRETNQLFTSNPAASLVMEGVIVRQKNLARGIGLERRKRKFAFCGISDWELLLLGPSAIGLAPRGRRLVKSGSSTNAPHRGHRAQIPCTTLQPPFDTRH